MTAQTIPPTVTAPVRPAASVEPIAVDRLTRVAAAVAPVAMLASTIAFVANGAGISEGEAGGAIEVWAAIAYAVALAGLARALGRSAPRIAVAVTGLGLAGACGIAAYGMDAIQQAVLAGDVSASPAVPFALRLPGLLFPLALLVLGVAVARSAAAGRGRLAGWALVAGAVLFPIGRIADLTPVALVTDVVLVGALPAVAAAVMGPERA